MAGSRACSARTRAISTTAGTAFAACGCAERGALTLPYYGRISALAVDPIEKKPLYHFHPGRTDPFGRLRWLFASVQVLPELAYLPGHRLTDTFLSPEELVDLARKEKSFGIAYTYSEPLIHAEYVMDAARAAHKAGLLNVLVSNGYLSPRASRRGASADGCGKYRPQGIRCGVLPSRDGR